MSFSKFCIYVPNYLIIFVRTLMGGSVLLLIKTSDVFLSKHDLTFVLTSSDFLIYCIFSCHSKFLNGFQCLINRRLILILTSEDWKSDF